LWYNIYQLVAANQGWQKENVTMALGVTDLKKGQVFQLDGVPYRVVEYGQKVMGRGGELD
jgi:uncharacterized protein YjhX (UPF0386 family)